MKIDTKTQNLELEGISKSDINYVKIIPNAVMLDLLQNRLYKNKIESPVRELLANAKDALVEISSQEPISLHAPTILEPYFAVEDFGVGMTSEEIENNFANLGSSSKRNTNELIGGFGIGSSTASIYAGQYSVKSTKNGVTSLYQFFKDEEGLPCHVKISEENTGEKSGTRIEIPVNSATDFKEFHEAIEKYVTWISFPVICNKEIKIDKPKFAHEVEGVFAITERPLNSQNSLIIIGGIPYELDFNQIGIKYYDSPIRFSHLILFAPIGEVSLTASRESPEFCDKTKIFIKSKWDEIKKWYTEYLASKTKFWLHQNTQPWEMAERKYFNYGFTILSKSWKKWTTSSNERVFPHYISVKDFKVVSATGNEEIKKINWKTACEKIGKTSNDVAFLAEADVPKLIKLGADPSIITKFEDLPKKKIGKRTGERVLYVKSNGGIGIKRIPAIVGETFNIDQKNATTQPNRWRPSYIKDILNDGVTITVDKSKPCQLMEWVRKKYGEYHNISYDNTVTVLKKLGLIEEKTKVGRPKNEDLMQHFGLIRGETVSLETKFPLIKNLSTAYWSTTEKAHAKYYVEWVLKKDPKALEHKHLTIL